MTKNLSKGKASASVFFFFFFCDQRGFLLLMKMLPGARAPAGACLQRGRCPRKKTRFLSAPVYLAIKRFISDFVVRMLPCLP